MKFHPVLTVTGFLLALSGMPQAAEFFSTQPQGSVTLALLFKAQED